MVKPPLDTPLCAPPRTANYASTQDLGSSTTGVDLIAVTPDAWLVARLQLYPGGKWRTGVLGRRVSDRYPSPVPEAGTRR